MPLTIAALTQKDAHQLAPIIAAYAQAMKRGAPRRPDEYYAELLAEDPATEVLGAFVGEELVGFAVFFDLPDTMSGHRFGHLLRQASRSGALPDRSSRINWFGY